MAKKIPIKLDVKSVEMVYNWSDLREFQEDDDFSLKDLTLQGYQRLEKSLLAHGFIVPVFIWKGANKEHTKRPYLLDGHQRKRFFDRGEYEIEGGKVPSLGIEAPSFEVAAQILLRMDSQHGTRTSQGLYAFTNKYSVGIDTLEDLDLPDLDFRAFKQEFFDEVDESDLVPEEFDEVSPDDVKSTHACPSCGYEWSGDPKNN